MTQRVSQRELVTQRVSPEERQLVTQRVPPEGRQLAELQVKQRHLKFRNAGTLPRAALRHFVSRSADV
jgi:hypothetical protein